MFPLSSTGAQEELSALGPQILKVVNKNATDRDGAFNSKPYISHLSAYAVSAVIEAPSKQTLSKRAYDASPKDAPLRSLFPDEPQPPKPVRCYDCSTVLSYWLTYNSLCFFVLFSIQFLP